MTAAAGGRPPGRTEPPRREEIVTDDEPDTAPVPKQSGDNTGLHDIQSLASSAKRRISQRISAEAEAQDSMLLSASSGAMKTVALPDPSKESSPEVERERIAALRQSGQMKISKSTSVSKESSAVAAPAMAAPAAASFGAGIVAKEKSAAPWWILGGVATLAAAAAVAVFVFDVGRDKSEDGEKTAASAADEAQVVASAEPAPPATPAPAPAATPTVEPMPEATTPPAEGAAAGAAVVQPLDESKDAKEEEDAEEPADKPDRSEAKPDAKGAKEKAPAPKSTEKAVKLKGTDLNDVLNQVTGGVEAPKTEEEKKAAVPSKKSLDRRDVDTAMEPVKGAALKCSALEQFEGSVMVKFTVAPSGQVTSASATNKKGPTGDCVAKAVKKAKFPAFDGSATSFTYPFLLAE
ncbi:MAG TPA: energy transducer TonB [Kofleriaceae bacterium]|nr:energy transducer TonB [Kofleriaceae bacterium]